MKVMFINNDGGGFADYIELPEGTTVSQLFSQKMQGASPSGYRISVDRLPATADQVLRDGQRISFTPTKVEAGCVG